MNGDFIAALRQIEKEKEIPFETLVTTLELAIGKAYKKNYAVSGEVVVNIDVNKSASQFKVTAEKLVVDRVTNGHAEVSLIAAREKKADVKLGDYVTYPVSPDSFGRIAAQTARQVMMQDVRDTERKRVYDEYSAKVGEVFNGIVQRRDGDSVYINIGAKLEAVLPPKEQVPGEPYRFNDRIKVYLLDVQKPELGAKVIVSRSHPSLIRRLFELEVPEIHDGTVEIKSVAREAGSRSKIAVYASDEKVDPVGACVGHRGGRVQAVVSELYDERIDIIRWNADIKQFVAESLSPAKSASVTVYEDKKSCFVVVPDNQLSLAIGKSGQNVRLAARLTGWRIDIRSESQVVRAAFEKAESEVESEKLAEGRPQTAPLQPERADVRESVPKAVANVAVQEEPDEAISYAEDITITADMLRDFDEED
jgi:transcription termination/antitermination protein NusA